jgi:hypothetical protein
VWMIQYNPRAERPTMRVDCLADLDRTDLSKLISALLEVVDLMSEPMTVPAGAVDWMADG